MATTGMMKMKESISDLRYLSGRASKLLGPGGEFKGSDPFDFPASTKGHLAAPFPSFQVCSFTSSGTAPVSGLTVAIERDYR